MSVWGDDINLSYSNPALLNKGCAKQVALNYCNYIADMNFGNVAYSRHFAKAGTLGGSIQFFNYGKFDKRDEYDVKLGNFKAADYSFNLTFARRLKDTSFSFGATLKTIYSHYDIYKSFGNAVDLGVTWAHKNGFTASAVIKNLGVIWMPYNKHNDTLKLPLTSQLGISYKVKKAPFRIIFVYDNLRTWDLTYTSPLAENTSTASVFGETPKEKTGFESAHHLYVIQLRLEKLSAGRAEIYEAMRKKGLGVQVHYIPLHLQPYYKRLGYQAGDYPRAEAYYERAISLPLFPAMTAAQVREVIRKVTEVLSAYEI